MSRTQLPEMGAIDPGVTAAQVLKDAYDEFVFTYADLDKCGDMEDHAYYAGRVDALFELLWQHTNTKNPATGLAKKTSSLIGDPSTYQVLENHMTEQVATDIAETLVPETAAVATTIQNLVPFAAGVGVGVLTVVVARRFYLKKKSGVVIANPIHNV